MENESAIRTFFEQTKQDLLNNIEKNNFNEVIEILFGENIDGNMPAEELSYRYFKLGQIFSRNYTRNQQEINLIELYDIKKDIDKAIICYEKGMNLGNVLCVNKLFNLFYYGQEVPRDYEKALNYAFIGAKQNDAPSFFHIGEMLLNGKGCQKDLKQAYLFFQKSYSLNPAFGGYELGVQQECGIFCEVHEHQALRYYVAAAEAGDKLAQFKCGSIYAGFYGNKFSFVKPNKELAMQYFMDYLTNKSTKITEKALGSVGRIMFETGNSKQKLEGIKKMQRAAKKGCSMARKYLKEQTSFGYLYPISQELNITQMQEQALSSK